MVNDNKTTLKRILVDASCTGCMSCYFSCPVAAIRIVVDDEGFERPSIDTSKCIECGACLKVCQCKSELKKETLFRQMYYRGGDKNINERRSSQSGGISNALAQYALSVGGVVYGCAINEKLKVTHVRASRPEDAYLIRGSKYTQSDIKDVYRLIVGDVSDKDIPMILVFGTPCQIDGIKNYLLFKKRDTTKVLFVDVICHGVGSPKIVDDYLKTYYRNAKSFLFRDKVFGWSSNIETIKGRRWTTHSERYAKLFFSGFGLRQSCYTCKYASYDRVSDITIGDFWNYVNSGVPYDDSGISEILVNTEKGRDYLSAASKKLCLYRISKDEANQYNLNMPTAISSYDERKEFWDIYNRCGLRTLVKKYANESLARRIVLKLYYQYRRIRRTLGVKR